MAAESGRHRKSSRRRGLASRLRRWRFGWGPGPCPDQDTYSEYFEGKLPPDEQTRVTAHLERCDRCGDDVQELIQALVKISERQDERVVGNSPGPRRFEWVDSKRLRTLLPGSDSAESKIPWPTSLLVYAAAGTEPSRIHPPRRTRPATLIVVALAVVLGAVLGTHLPKSRRETTPDSTARAERLVTPRFTGGLAWAPLVGRWSAQLSREPYLEPGTARYVAAAQQRRRASADPTAAELGAVGAVYALGGRTESAVEALQRATAAAPDSAELLSDLGAALLARAELAERRRLQNPGAELEDRDADIPAALEAIDRALEISPRLPEALFNRALALERLYLRRSALAAWQAYLDVDDSGAWAREAQRRLEAIVIPARPDPARIRAEIAAAADGGDRERLAELVASHRHLARASVQEDLLPGWAEAWLSGDRTAAERQLAAARLIADEWEAQTTDLTLREAVAEIENATGSALERLVTAYRDLGQASRALAAFDLDAAEGAAERALSALPAESPALAWAALVRLACLGYRGGEVGAQASAIARHSPRDLATIGRAWWISGVLHVRHGNFATALAEYRLSLDAYERLDDVEPAVALHHLIGDVYGLMGTSDACWRHRRIALEQAAILTDRERAMDILRLSGILALYQGHPRVAADFLAATLAEPDMSEPDQIARTYLWRGRVLRELGRRHEAAQELRRAGAWMSRARPFERRDLAPDLDFAYGLVATDPEQAVQLLSRAFDGFRARGLHWRLPGILLARARAHVLAGQAAAAEADLRQGLALMDEEGGQESRQLSTPRFDRPDELFAERVRLALMQGRADDAFAAAEAGRAQRVRALTRNGEARADSFTGAPLRPAEVAARLDPNTTLVLYSWLSDGVTVWRVERSRVSVVRLGKSPRDLRRLISAFAADLEAGAWTAATRETAMQLYSALLAPVKPANGRLVIVPDKDLHSLPFAALIDPTSGRFLIEEREVAIAPSAVAFLRSRARRVKLPDTPRDALVVGDPRTDPTLFPAIRSLPGARLEAREVAALYSRRELLLGNAATRAAFLAALGHRDVVHFSGHALANRVDPDRSSLPLAEKEGRSGLLVAADIARLDLTGTQAVVLSGCETGVGNDGGGGGPLSLAHAFLAAGVSDVVASLWPIADVPSAPLMTAFHRRLLNGEPPAKALRAAQLLMMHSTESAQRSPGVWAAFESFGG